MMVKQIPLTKPPLPGRLVERYRPLFSRFSEKHRRMVAEVLMLTGAWIAFVWCGPLIYLADATASPLDPGILSALVFAAAAVGTAWLLARILMAAIMHQVVSRMVEPLDVLTPWQQLLMSLGTYCSFFWGFIWVLVALL